MRKKVRLKVASSKKTIPLKWFSNRKINLNKKNHSLKEVFLCMSSGEPNEEDVTRFIFLSQKGRWVMKTQSSSLLEGGAINLSDAVGRAIQCGRRAPGWLVEPFDDGGERITVLITAVRTNLMSVEWRILRKLQIVSGQQLAYVSGQIISEDSPEYGQLVGLYVVVRESRICLLEE